MGARFVILLVVAGGLALFFALKDPTAESSQPIASTKRTVGDGKPFWGEPLPGEEPAVPPEFDVTVEVDTSAGKNRLYLNISEKHGYYVERPKLRFWFTDGGKYTTPQDSPLSRIHYLETYLKANETLRTCIEVVDAELRHVSNLTGIGETGDWAARVEEFVRARVRNPEVFQPVDEYSTCD